MEKAEREREVEKREREWDGKGRKGEREGRDGWILVSIRKEEHWPWFLILNWLSLLRVNMQIGSYCMLWRPLPKWMQCSWLWFSLLCASCFQYLEMGQLSSLQFCNRKASCESLGSGRWVLEPLAKLRSAQSCLGQCPLSGTEDWHHAW